MINPVSTNLNLYTVQKLDVKKEAHPAQNNVSRLQLSGYNNPMKSYISFGWCTAHYQAMYELDEKLTEKLTDKLQEIQALKTKEAKAARYSIVDDASIEAAKIIAQYANMQCVVAEVPPSYALITGGKLKAAMDKSETLTNPVSLLVSINAINKMTVKNKNLNESQLDRAKGFTQLYSMAILLKQIDENKSKPEYKENEKEIEEMLSMVKKSMKDIYGDDVLDRIEKFAYMGKTPTSEEKREALDFLIQINANSREINLPDAFENKLKTLIAEQNAKNGKTDEHNEVIKPLSLKVYYPDHEHTPEHTHGNDNHHSHEYMHSHDIPHTHEHSYKEMEEHEKIQQEQNKHINN